VRRAALLVVASLVSLAACSDDPSQLMRGRSKRATTTTTSGGGADDADATGVTSDGSDTSSGGSSGTSTSDGGTSSGGSSGTGTSGGSATPTPAGTTAEEVCVAAINDYRKTLGRAPLARWTAAETCSDTEAQSDGATGTAHGAFPKCGEFAQNECPGWPGAPATMIKGCLQAMWNEGPGGGHHDNMASTTWKSVACGFHTLPNGDVWAVQNFK
jgi:hypothetical protein